MNLTKPLTPDESIRETIRAAAEAARESGTSVDMTVRVGPTTDARVLSVGPAASSRGGEISSDFSADPTSVDLIGGTVEAGGVSRHFEGLTRNQDPLGHWAFWVGVFLIIAAGVLWWRRFTRAATAAGVAGLGMLTVAVYPATLLFAIGGVALYLFWPLIRAEFGEKKKEQVTANIAAMVDSLPEEDRKRIKALIKEQTNRADRDTIDEVKKKYRIGKYSGSVQ